MDEEAPAVQHYLGIVLTDDRQLIQSCNMEFLDATGYDADEVIGRNCNFLQGPETSRETTRRIREALKHDESVQVRLVNYRKDGTKLSNFLRIYPLMNKQGRVDRYLGIQLFDQSIYIDRPTGVFPWISPQSLEEQKRSGIVRAGHLIEPSESSSFPPVDNCEAGSVQFIAETHLPTKRGTFRVRAYRDACTCLETIVLMPEQQFRCIDVPLRVHDQCFTSEVLGSLKCDCQDQLHWSMEYIQQHGGAVVYLQQEGRGMGLANKIKAYQMQELGYDTVDANHVLGFDQDTREYHMIPEILASLGIQSIRLMTNNPRKVRHLRALGVPIAGRIPIVIPEAHNKHSSDYLHSKAARMGHLFDESLK